MVKGQDNREIPQLNAGLLILLWDNYCSASKSLLQKVTRCSALLSIFWFVLFAILLLVVLVIIPF